MQIQIPFANSQSATQIRKFKLCGLSNRAFVYLRGFILPLTSDIHFLQQNKAIIQPPRRVVCHRLVLKKAYVACAVAVEEASKQMIDITYLIIGFLRLMR